MGKFTLNMCRQHPIDWGLNETQRSNRESSLSLSELDALLPWDLRTPSSSAFGPWDLHLRTQELSGAFFGLTLKVTPSVSLVLGPLDLDQSTLLAFLLE